MQQNKERQAKKNSESRAYVICIIDMTQVDICAKIKNNDPNSAIKGKGRNKSLIVLVKI